MTLAFKVLKCR